MIGQKQFRRRVEIEHHPFPFQLQAAGAARRKQGGGAFPQDMHLQGLGRDAAVPAQQEEPPVNQEWTDPWAPGVLPPEEQEPAAPAPAFVLPTPSVTVTGAAAVEQGASVQLEARVTDDYNPSYQWYVWEESSQQWQALGGQTDSRYQPDTSSAGNRAYLCEVTNHGPDGQTTTAYSEPAAVQVEAKQELPTPTVVGVTGATRVEQG